MPLIAFVKTLDPILVLWMRLPLKKLVIWENFVASVLLLTILRNRRMNFFALLILCPVASRFSGVKSDDKIVEIDDEPY